jgi:hypothetical protein
MAIQNQMDPGGAAKPSPMQMVGSMVASDALAAMTPEDAAAQLNAPDPANGTRTVDLTMAQRVEAIDWDEFAALSPAEQAKLALAVQSGSAPTFDAVFPAGTKTGDAIATSSQVGLSWAEANCVTVDALTITRIQAGMILVGESWMTAEEAANGN